MERTLVAMTPHTDPRDPAFLREVAAIKAAIGRRPLSEDEMVVLACEEISRTYTHDEKSYRA
jgi:hypothetical protein